MRINLLYLLIILLIDACVERLDVPVIQSKKVLVVDGSITNQPGPHTVKLFYSSQLDEVIKTPEPFEAARAWITENNTTEYELTETKSGVYETSVTFTGMIGHTYKINIETEDGKKYESVPAVMKDAGSLNRVFAEFKENVINPNDLSEPQDAFYLYIDGTGAKPQGNLLRWRWNATYQVHTAPALRVKKKGDHVVPDPPPCSGVVFDFLEDEFIPVGLCSCCDCWVTFYDETVAISDPVIVSGNSFNKVLLGIIPIKKNIYFLDKLLIRVDQLSVSEEVYSFWNLVKTQQEGAQNIFQPEIVKVRGNIFSITNSEEEVFGIFSVSGIAENKIELTLDDIPKQIPEYEVINDDCRYTGGTNVKPSFY